MQPWLCIFSSLHLKHYTWQTFVCKFRFVSLVWLILFNRFCLVYLIYSPRNKFGSVKNLVCFSPRVFPLPLPIILGCICCGLSECGNMSVQFVLKTFSMLAVYCLPSLSDQNRLELEQIRYTRGEQNNNRLDTLGVNKIITDQLHQGCTK